MIHAPTTGRKFPFLLSVKLRVYKISFFILLMEKENNRKLIVCFIQKTHNSIWFEK